MHFSNSYIPTLLALVSVATATGGAAPAEIVTETIHETVHVVSNLGNCFLYPNGFSPNTIFLLR